VNPIAPPPPDPIDVAICEVAGRGGVSQFLTEAAENRLRRTAMIEWLREAAAEAGPPDQDYAADLEDAFAGARASMCAAADRPGRS